MENCKNKEHKKPCIKKEHCEDCGIPTCSANFAYHICTGNKRIKL